MKVHFCGMQIHRPFFADEAGNEIVASYQPIRDFFARSLPHCNWAIAPEDINELTTEFVATAKSSGLPFWDNSQFNYYFEFFRWWILRKGYLKAYDLSKVYQTQTQNSVVIFPRKFNPNSDPKAQLNNNGEIWNFEEIARIASENFDKVYVIGHPSFSEADFRSLENVEVHITNNNALILELCSNSQLIVSQHSGTVYLRRIHKYAGTNHL